MGLLDDLSEAAGDAAGKTERPKPKQKKPVDKKKATKKIKPVKPPIDVYYDDEEEEVAPENVSFRTALANMKIKEENAIQSKIESDTKRGEMIKRDYVTNSVSPFISQLFTSIETQIGGSFLTDSSKKIVEAGGITPEIRAAFQNEIKKTEDDSKKEWIKILGEKK